MARGARPVAPADVRAVFADLDPLRAMLVARAIGAADAPRRRLWRLAQADPAWLPSVIEVRGAEHLQGPIVAVAWHAGLADVIPSALAIAGRAGLTLSQNARPLVRAPGFDHAAIDGGTVQRAAAFARAIAALRDGRVVGLVAGFVDPLAARAPSPVVMLGRRVPLTRGPATMARLGRASLVPCAAWLEPARIVVRFDPPLAPDDDDDRTTLRLAAHFEGELRAHPERLWRESFAALLALPHV